MDCITCMGSIEMEKDNKKILFCMINNKEIENPNEICGNHTNPEPLEPNEIQLYND